MIQEPKGPRPRQQISVPLSVSYWCNASSAVLWNCPAPHHTIPPGTALSVLWRLMFPSKREANKKESLQTAKKEDEGLHLGPVLPHKRIYFALEIRWTVQFRTLRAFAASHAQRLLPRAGLASAISECQPISLPAGCLLRLSLVHARVHASSIHVTCWKAKA